jgi:broad specificity phosphatase PhoE
MDLILVRHGLPVRTEPVPGAPPAPPDPDLSAIGRRQADQLADALTSRSIDAVYTSPLRRAVQTVEPLAAKLGLPITVEDGVHEINMGESSYIPVEELLADDPRTQLFRDVLDDPDSKLITEFRARVGATVAAIAARHPGRTALIGCHAGVISAALTNLLGGPNTFAFHVGYASVTLIKISRRGRTTVFAVNERCHLRD